MSCFGSIQSLPSYLLLCELHRIDTNSIVLKENHYVFKEPYPNTPTYMREELLDDSLRRAMLNTHEITTYLVKHPRLGRWSLAWGMITVFVEAGKLFHYFRGNFYVM